MFEILADIQAKAGSDFPVGIRINGNDYMANGWELTDALTLAPLLEAAGAAYLHVSAGVYGSTELTIPSMYTPQGCFVHLAEAVKQVVDIPVITVGRIKDPLHAEQIIADGRADIVALGRSFLADPRYPEKPGPAGWTKSGPVWGAASDAFMRCLPRSRADAWSTRMWAGNI